MPCRVLWATAGPLHAGGRLRTYPGQWHAGASGETRGRRRCRHHGTDRRGPVIRCGDGRSACGAMTAVRCGIVTSARGSTRPRRHERHELRSECGAAAPVTRSAFDPSAAVPSTRGVETSVPRARGTTTTGRGTPRRHASSAGIYHIGLTEDGDRGLLREQRIWTTTSAPASTFSQVTAGGASVQRRMTRLLGVTTSARRTPSRQACWSAGRLQMWAQDGRYHRLLAGRNRLTDGDAAHANTRTARAYSRTLQRWQRRRLDRGGTATESSDVREYMDDRPEEGWT